MKKHTQRILPKLIAPPRVLVVEARFYDEIADALFGGAEKVLQQAGAKIDRVSVPGALEIPGAIAHAANSGQYDAFVALGCIIRGETYHFEIVCNESARGILHLTLEGLPVGNGIITVNTLAQAQERADHARLDKGGDAAMAALHLLSIAQKYAVGDL